MSNQSISRQWKSDLAFDTVAVPLTSSSSIPSLTQQLCQNVFGEAKCFRLKMFERDSFNLDKTVAVAGVINAGKITVVGKRNGYI